MAVAGNFAKTSGNSVSANTDYLLYTATSKTLIKRCSVTCLAAAGITAEMKITDGSGVVVEYILPPSTSVSQNNGFVESGGIVLLNGYKVYIKCSLAINATPDNAVFAVSVWEGVP